MRDDGDDFRSIAVVDRLGGDASSVPVKRTASVLDIASVESLLLCPSFRSTQEVSEYVEMRPGSDSKCNDLGVAVYRERLD